MASSSAISSLGVGSGLDLSSLLNSLGQAEQTRMQPLEARKSSYNAELSAYGKLTSAATSLQSAADKLNDPSLYESTKVSTSGEAFTASSSEDAVPGTYNVEVTQLAQAQSLVASPVVDSAEAIGSGGTLDIAVGDNEAVTIDIGEDSSLEDIRDAINGSEAGVSASIMNDGSDTPYHLVLSSNETGVDNQMTISATDAAGANGTPLADLLSYDGSDTSAMSQTVAAQNAELSVNGIQITRNSNTVEDAIQGVTLSLTSTTDKPQQLNATQDDESVRSAIESFVSSYNSYIKTSNNLTAFNGADSTSGVLLGDSTARGVDSRLRDAINTVVSGNSFASLSDIGISTKLDGANNLRGTLEIDDETLDKALADDSRGVAQLFSGDPTVDDDHNGVAGGLSNTIALMTDDGGSLAAASDGAQNSIDRLDDRMDRMQESIDASVERYRQQFIALDSAMAKLNSTQSYLTTQFEAMNSSDS